MVKRLISLLSCAGMFFTFYCVFSERLPVLRLFLYMLCAAVFVIFCNLTHDRILPVIIMGTGLVLTAYGLYQIAHALLPAAAFLHGLNVGLRFIIYGIPSVITGFFAASHT